MTTWRYAVAAVLLVFAWKGASIDLPWPPSPTDKAVVPQPAPELIAWVEPLKPILPKMLAKDRRYLSSLYDAMAFVLLRDRDRPSPIIDTTDKFIAFHSGSLALSIDRKDVGKYDGLAGAIDQVFLSALGPESRGLNDDDRVKLTAACSTLAYVFRVGGNE
jgi:hypothetical protein